MEGSPLEESSIPINMPDKLGGDLLPQHNSKDKVAICKSGSSILLQLDEVSSDDFLSVMGDMDIKNEISKTSCKNQTAPDVPVHIYAEPGLEDVTETSVDIPVVSADVSFDMPVVSVDTPVISVDQPITYAGTESTPESMKKAGVFDHKDVESDSDPNEVASNMFMETDTASVHDYTNLEDLKKEGVTTTCHRFIVESLGNSLSGYKDVEAIPGIGKKYGFILRHAGIKTAKNLYGHFLINPDGFKDYLIGFGFDAGNASEAYQALKMWDDNNF